MKLIAAPASEPVSLPEAKLFCRADHSDEDDLIRELIVAMRVEAESFTRRAFMTQTWELSRTGFPACFELAHPPLVSVSSIKYDDVDGNEQTLAADQYSVLNAGAETALGLVVPAPGVVAWPSTQADKADTVRVQFVAGYGDADAVPAPIKLAIKRAISMAYDQRSSGGGGGLDPIAEKVLFPYQVAVF